MTTNEIGTVIGMVCDKVGLVVDKVQPLAEEVVRQYAQKEMLYAVECAIFAGFFAMLGLIGTFFAIRGFTTEEQTCSTEAFQIGGTMSAIGFLMFACMIADTAFTHYGRAIAPLCGLIGK